MENIQMTTTGGHILQQQRQEEPPTITQAEWIQQRNAAVRKGKALRTQLAEVQDEISRLNAFAIVHEGRITERKPANEQEPIEQD